MKGSPLICPPISGLSVHAGLKMVKVKFALEEAIIAWRGSIASLFL
jgi:hypothetical protein